MGLASVCSKAMILFLLIHWLYVRVAMESSHSVEPEIYFSPAKKTRYEQYSSELCVFSHKSESVDSLWRGTIKGLCRVK